MWYEYKKDIAKLLKKAEKKHKLDMEAYKEAAGAHAASVAALKTTIAGTEDEKKVKQLERDRTALESEAHKEPRMRVPRMHMAEVDLTLKLATALKLLLASSTTREQRVRGAKLLADYLVGYKEVSVVFPVRGAHRTDTQMHSYMARRL